MAGLMSYLFLGAGFLLMVVGVFLYSFYFPVGVPFWVWILVAAAFILIVIGLVSSITGQVMSGGYDSSGYPYGYNFYYKRPVRPDDNMIITTDDYKSGPLAVTNVDINR
jgi:hypothetical protein